jgi:hypothetical protein
MAKFNDGKVAAVFKNLCWNLFRFKKPGQK